MKVTLYMAMTVNGLVAKADDNVDFVSKASWASYRAIVERIGNVIVGQRTYQLMQEAGDLDGLRNIQVVVVGEPQEIKADPSTLVADSPAAALAVLEKKDFQEALVAGGGTLNGSFMKEGLINEIILDVEPVIFGKGIRLFGDGDFETQLELIESKQLAPNEIQLRYRVQK